MNNDTLYIPKELIEYKGIKQIFNYQNESTILYKNMDFNLINFEFYTQTYCIVFNCNGTETITSYDYQNVQIGKNELIFLPKDTHLISDFIKNNQNLEAYMLFFNDEIIEKYLSMKNIYKLKQEKSVSFYKMNTNDSVFQFIKSLSTVSKDQYDSKHFLELKLLEFLHIVDAIDDRIIESLNTNNENKNKRNIRSLMKKYYLNDFSMKDFAKLSGRSLSTFHRDFKSSYKQTPKQYLLNLRLEYAHNELLRSTKSVSQIANEIAYNNISHFIKAFKLKYGITPKQLSKAEMT